MARATRGKYLQYKADTRALSTWLARAAINHGFSASAFLPSDRASEEDVEPRTASQIRNAKKKAKARARAKAARATGEPLAQLDGSAENAQLMSDSEVSTVSKCSDTPLSGDYQIKMSSFVSIAKHLVEKAVKIPIEIMRLLRRCITRRLEYLEQFLGDSDKVTDQHRHFIDVLLHVEAIFQDGGATVIADEVDAKSKDKVDGFDAFSNRFEALRVEGREEEDEEDVPDICLPEPPKPPGAPATATASFAPEDSMDEIITRPSWLITPMCTRFVTFLNRRGRTTSSRRSTS